VNALAAGGTGGPIAFVANGQAAGGFAGQGTVGSGGPMVTIGGLNWGPISFPR
jgi:hypothetical protein